MVSTSGRLETVPLKQINMWRSDSRSNWCCKGGYREERKHGARRIKKFNLRNRRQENSLCFFSLFRLREVSLFSQSIERNTPLRVRDFLNTTAGARARTSVIWAGKFGHRRHSTTSFSANVVVAKTSQQMLEVLSFFDRESMQPPSLKITELTFLVKYGKMELSGKSIF